MPPIIVTKQKGTPIETCYLLTRQGSERQVRVRVFLLHALIEEWDINEFRWAITGDGFPGSGREKEALARARAIMETYDGGKA